MASNLISSDLVSPSLRDHVRYGLALNITDANNNAMKMVGYPPLLVRLGNCVVQLEFIVYYSLAVQVIRGCNFCDRFVEEISPRARHIKIEYGDSIPSLRVPSKRATRKRVILHTAQNVLALDAASTKIQIAKLVISLSDSQVWITATSNQHGVPISVPLPSLSDRRQTALASGEMSVKLEKPFEVLGANLGKTPQELAKNQVIGTMLPQSTAIVLPKIPVN